MSNDARQEQGYSILEVAVATGVLLGVLGCAFGLINQSANVGKSQQTLAFSQNNLRNVLTVMSKDIQKAGFFDTVQTTRTSASVGTFSGIPAATATSTGFKLITQEWNGTADVSQTITYAYDAVNKRITRNQISATGTPNNLTLLSNASQIDSSTPVFSYIDDPNDSTSKIGVTVQLQTDTGQIDPYTKQPITRQIKTTILSRNSKYASDRLTISISGGSGGGGSGTDFSNVPSATN
jgi:Tfp pilus assembly protein PilW